MDDAHQMLSHPESLPIWTERLDAFLARIGLPATPVYPGYLPTPLPPPTHFAVINDVAAVPYLSARGRAAYRAFLTRRFTRAFVIAPNGAGATASGGFDPIARALALCRRHATGCQLYAVDNNVVWIRTAPSPTGGAMTQGTVGPLFRRVVAAGVTTTLDFSYGVNRDCTSRGVPRLWVVRAPVHGRAQVKALTSFPQFPANNPYFACNTVKVPGTAAEYTSAAGFTGADSIEFEEINLDNRNLVFRVAITVR